MNVVSQAEFADPLSSRVGEVEVKPRAGALLAVKADEAVAYGTVMKVMDVIKKAGIEKQF